VKSGDFVWMPVGVPGATTAVEEKKGIDAVFGPSTSDGSHRATLDTRERHLPRMSDYLTPTGKITDHHRPWRHGDVVMRVFDHIGVKACEIPVVGWGNSQDTTAEVKGGYVNAACGRNPAKLSRSVAGVKWRRGRVPPGFNSACRLAL